MESDKRRLDMLGCGDIIEEYKQSLRAFTRSKSPSLSPINPEEFRHDGDAV